MISAPAQVTILDVLDIVDKALASVSRNLPAHVSREDLRSAGSLALVRAFPSAAGNIRAHLFARVRGAMLDELRQMDSMSRGDRARYNEVQDAIGVLERRHGRAPTASEVSAHLGWKVARVDAISASAGGDVSLDAESAEGLRLADVIADENATIPGEDGDAPSLRSALVAALGRLTPGQAAAVRIVYLEDGLLDDVARQLNVSRERARQLRDAGIKRLRADLAMLSLWQGIIATRES